VESGWNTTWRILSNSWTTFSRGWVVGWGTSNNTTRRLMKGIYVEWSIYTKSSERDYWMWTRRRRLLDVRLVRRSQPFVC